MIETDYLLRETQRAIGLLQQKEILADPRSELLQNTYPLMALVTEALGRRLDSVEGALHELLSNSESIITPELADSLVKAYAAGFALCQLLTSPAGKTRDGQQKIAELIVSYRQLAAGALEEIKAYTMDPDEGDDEDGEMAFPTFDLDSLDEDTSPKMTAAQQAQAVASADGDDDESDETIDDDAVGEEVA